MNRTSVTSLLAGIGIGAGIGILFAPRSGTRTRVLLARRTREQAEQLKNQAAGLRDRAASLIERGEQEVLLRKEGLSRAIETGTRAYRQALS